MDQHEKRKLENELMVMGLAQLNDPALIQQLAMLVNAWPEDRHEYLMSLLNECEPAQRSEMYNAITPYLHFKPWSLDTYLMRNAEKAGAMISQNRLRVEGEAPKPITVGGVDYAAVPLRDATHAIATVRCHVCNKVEKFLADTPAGAMIAARKDGWQRDKSVNKEICAICVEDRQMEAAGVKSDA
jgi:hypothetical protein